MKFKFDHLAIALCILCVSCASSNRSSNEPANLPATQLKPYGRFIVDTQQSIELISSAAHVGFSFEGTECQLFASLPNAGSHNYLQYELDGTYQKRIKISGNTTQPIVLATQTEGKHTIWIYKATEAYTGAILIQKISGKNVKPLQRPAAPLIEFIGNSITCGAAADASEVPCGTGEYHDHHNAYYAYGPRVARALGTNFIVSGVSGIGVYRNWNSDGPAMPAVYEESDFQANKTQPWNFNLFAPQIVSIALGTNDFSNGDGKKKRLPFDSATFVKQYISFVNLVKSKYSNAQIALLSSPMIGGNGRLILQNCLSAVKQNIDALHPSDKPVALYFFEPMQPHGCSGHPNVEDHAILAKQLIPFFKNLL
ncbi:MAG: family lipase [Ferruginibacter sp.]|nr:family lipase [Ferruginibacter sp.]